MALGSVWLPTCPAETQGLPDPGAEPVRVTAHIRAKLLPSRWGGREAGPPQPSASQAGAGCVKWGLEPGVRGPRSLVLSCMDLASSLTCYSPAVCHREGCFLKVLS